MPPKKPLWIELPLRKDTSNSSMIKYFKFRFQGLVNAVVISDKAAGLDHFCEVEEVIKREFIPNFILSTQTPVINVLKTGDRCPTHCRKMAQKLVAHGSSRLLLVSGHDYCGKQLLREQRGAICPRACVKSGLFFCGIQSSEVFNTSPIWVVLSPPPPCIIWSHPSCPPNRYFTGYF